ncbi:hypothetical protein SEUCBS140593_006361 [Sporothrix eucalyptigena]|uniref:Sphingomyelin phosphodiesterase n=1 Tax=Sporothrix eucalyptigena TaxID=1812306 RepID=A0ABP0C484_9PEZI
MKTSSLLSSLVFATAVSAAVTPVMVPPVTPRSIEALKRSTVSEIWDAIESAASCAACEAVLTLLQVVAHLGNDDFVDVITEICILAGIEDTDVCEGSIALEGPIIAHDLRSMSIGSHTSEVFCAYVFGLCSLPAVRSYSVPFPSAKPATSRPASSGKTPIQVVHFSDIHVDRFYETGASYNCTKNICCRPYTTADAPGNNDYPAGAYGNHACDSPVTLEESLYSAAKTIAPDAAFTIFTGDVVEGAIWLVNETEVTTDLQDAYAMMASYGLPTVYGVVGNHDTAPVNSWPPADIDTTISSQWAYDTLSSAWAQWIGSSDAATADTNPGAYSAVTGNLRIISINTNMYYEENFWLYAATMETDPSGQLAWLVDELQAAETAGQRVWLLGHMPMGSSNTLYDGSNYFQQIVDRYEATIAALFFGHTHKDEFEVAYSDYTARSAANAIAMSYIAPALTPTSGMPAFRVYSVDPFTYGVLDVVTYAADMSSPTYDTNGPVWTKYYSAKEAYGPLVGVDPSDTAAELTPAFWHNLTEVLLTNQTAFDEYYARKSRGYDVSSCTGDCVTSEVCLLQSAEAQYNCWTPSVGIHFSKRDEGSDGHKHDECEPSLTKRLFHHIRASAEKK